jgi:vacuolar iron transporter family protein
MSRADVVRAGVGSAVAYAVGAASPLVITFTVPVRVETWAVLVAVLVSLTVTSIVGAHTGRMNVARTLVRRLVVGVGTLAVSYVVGRLVL